MKALVAVSEHPGHAFPAFALARGLRERGHEVVVATVPRWREAVEGVGAEALVGDGLGDLPAIAAPLDAIPETARASAAIVSDVGPEILIGDVLVPAMALAAERAGVPRATLVSVPYPGRDEGQPPHELGLLPPRTPLGALLWRAGARLARPRLPGAAWLPSGARGMNAIREELGLPPLARDDGPVTEGPTLVVNLPQLEPRRAWPPGVHVTGAMIFDPAAEPVELPPGDAPLVFVAASTQRDPESRLVRTAVEALADEPLRVVASTGGRDSVERAGLPANAVVADWVSYAQLIPAASLVVSQGGQGTLVRALTEGVPVLVCPDAADMAGNGARLVTAGAGAMVPRRLLGPRSLRSAVRALLADPHPRAKAAAIAAWAASNPGEARAAELVERHAAEGAG